MTLRRMWLGAAIGVVSTACVSPSTASEPDPCGGAPTCVTLDVDSATIHTIDQLALDLVYNGTHSTAVTGTFGVPQSLPVTTAVILDVSGNPLIHLDVIVSGELGGSVLASDASSTTVQPGNHGSMFLELSPMQSCAEGTVYCGGIGGLIADFESLYRCTGGLLAFYAKCPHGCTSSSGQDAVCFGGGLCTDGGTYCGGDLVDGDPNTLYVCHEFRGSVVSRCPGACIVQGAGNDACQ